MEASSPMYRLPDDIFHQIFQSLPLRQIMICRCACKLFDEIISSPFFLHLISNHPPLRLLALRPTAAVNPSLHFYDPDLHRWLRFSLDFLPFQFPSPVASSLGLLYLWAESPKSPESPESNKSLVVCNPLTRQFRVLPPLGSAWSRHGSVLVDSASGVMVLTELAVLYFSGSDQWSKYCCNLPSKPRSPVLVSDSVYALCDVGSPWRSQWKLFSSSVTDFNHWGRVERQEWGDVFDILERPRLVAGIGNQILMVGGLKSSYSMSASCSTIVILRLDLETSEWDEAGRMPVHMFQCFQQGSGKFKMFGSGDRICFSGEKTMALWDRCSSEDEWRWIPGVPEYSEGLHRGFMFEARFTPLRP